MTSSKATADQSSEQTINPWIRLTAVLAMALGFGWFTHATMAEMLIMLWVLQGPLPR